MSSFLFSGFIRLSSLPSGSFEKAASVGAKTVNGPVPRRVSVKPACFMALLKMLKDAFAAAVSSRFVDDGVV